MKYNLNNLDSNSFEQLIQSLVKKILGNGTITFGDGIDGGREATFRGKSPYPSVLECWDGYWVVQAKFRTSEDPNTSNFTWIQDELTKELEKYKTRVIKVEYPDNYLMFTNVSLSAVPSKGGLDKAEQLERDYEKKYNIKHIKIISYTDIHAFIDGHRDIAISYAPFLLAGDVLFKMLELLEFQKERQFKIQETIYRYVEAEFLEDSQSKLDHAGNLRNDKVNLEKVFIDLRATRDGSDSKDPKFASKVLQQGNLILKGGEIPNKFVLIAGPGYGKSTLTQFITQIYRAYLLKTVDKHDIKLKEIDLFINDYKENINVEPKWIRLPIRITLKEYAGWIADSKKINPHEKISVIDYIRFLINKKSTVFNISNEELEIIIKTMPSFFVFDGLDEVPASSNRKDVISEITIFTDIFLRRIEADTIIISTTRPQGYSKEFDSTKYQHLYITDIGEEACIDYLKKLLNNIISDSQERENKLKILKQALGDKDVSRLMKSPLQASIMAILVKSGGEPPRKRFNLFSEYYDIIFRREKQRSISKILSDNPEYVKEIHDRLGFFLQAVSEKDTNPSALLEINVFKKMIEDYLISIGLSVEESRSIAEQINTAATKRLVFIDEVEDNKIGFAIRTLQEYFAAYGYIHNVPDTEITEKLRTICQSSYWSNTLMFVIGYISEYKKYLTVSIESVCNELNGSTNQINCQSLQSKLKLGSLLALDILNEAIFRGKPNSENMFCNMLEPLFSVSPTKRTKSLAVLPEKIINQWIIPLIKKTLMLNERNFTAWTVACFLIEKEQNCDDIITQFLPTNFEARSVIYDIFFSENVYDKLIFQEFLNDIPNYSISELWPLIFNENNSWLLDKLSNTNIPDHSKPALSEILVLAVLDDYLPSDFDFTQIFRELNIINIDKIIPDSGIIEYAKDVIILEVVAGYTCKIIKPSKHDFADLFESFNNDNNLSTKLLESLFTYLGNPSPANFISMRNEVLIFDQKSQSLIIGKIRGIDSFINTIYSNNVEDNELDNIFDSLIQLDGSQLDQNKYFGFMKYNLSRTLNISNLSERLLEYSKIYDIADNEQEKLEYVYLFSWSLLNMQSNESNAIKNDEKIKQAYLNAIVTSPIKTFFFRDYIGVFYLFDVLSIKKIFESFSSEKLIHPKITLADLSLNTTSEIAHTSFLSICAYVKYQILTRANANYEILYFITYDLILQGSSFVEEYIPFSDMLNDKSSDSQIYKVGVLLLDHNYSEKHSNEFKLCHDLNECLLTDFEYLKAIIRFLKNSCKNQFIEDVILYIHEKLNKALWRMKVDFSEFLLQYLESKPSNIDVPAYI